MKKRILFTGGGGAAVEALWRFWSDKYELYFADASLESIANIIPAERKLLIPFANESRFISEIKRLCQEQKIDVLVPTVDEELLPLCENRNAAGMPEIFAPQIDFVKLMLDKFECIKSIKKHGLSVPQTVTISEANQLTFPCIVKPKSGRGSRGVSILASEKEIEAYQVLNKTPVEQLLAQELAQGDEYTVLVSGDKTGRLKAIVPVKIAQKKGITIRASTDLNYAVIEYTKQFHAAFKPHGIYNLQCILTKNDEVLPFEINPRISTTFCLGVAAGFDPFKETQLQDDEIFLPKQTFSLKRNWFNDIR